MPVRGWPATRKLSKNGHRPQTALAPQTIHSRTVECELYASAQLRCMRQECNRESNQEWSEGRARCLAFCPTRRSKNLPASIRQRLLNLEQEHNDEFALIPTKYGLERMLFRLSLWCIADSHPRTGELFSNSMPILLISQSNHRIYAHRAARRDVASREHNESEQKYNTCECREVRRFHLEEQTGHQVGQRQRSCNSGGDAEQGDSRSISHNEPQDVDTLRSQRRPYADLMRSLVRGISHRAIDS